LWLFGKPLRPLTGFAQARIEVQTDGSFAVRVRDGVQVEGFGDAAGIAVGALG
jgi:hypothetical protein